MQDNVLSTLRCVTEAGHISLDAATASGYELAALHGGPLSFQ